MKLRDVWAVGVASGLLGYQVARNFGSVPAEAWQIGNTLGGLGLFLGAWAKLLQPAPETPNLIHNYGLVTKPRRPRIVVELQTANYTKVMRFPPLVQPHHIRQYYREIVLKGQPPSERNSGLSRAVHNGIRDGLLAANLAYWNQRGIPQQGYALRLAARHVLRAIVTTPAPTMQKDD